MKLNKRPPWTRSLQWAIRILSGQAGWVKPGNQQQQDVYLPVDYLMHYLTKTGGET